MKSYMTYVIKNSNKDEFMVCWREGMVDGHNAWMTYKTFEEAYRIAKIYNHGNEPVDETRHH